MILVCKKKTCNINFKIIYLFYSSINYVLFRIKILIKHSYPFLL